MEQAEVSQKEDRKLQICKYLSCIWINIGRVFLIYDFESIDSLWIQMKKYIKEAILKKERVR